MELDIFKGLGLDKVIFLVKTEREFPGLISLLVSRGYCLMCSELVLSGRGNIGDFLELFVCDEVAYQEYSDVIYNFIWSINGEYMRMYERCAFPTYIAALLFSEGHPLDVIQEKVREYKRKWSDFLNHLYPQYFLETGEWKEGGEERFLEDLEFILADVHNMFRETVGKNKKRV